jgi:Uma2 family endonuclease
MSFVQDEFRHNTLSLPCHLLSDVPMETDLHRIQTTLLIQSLEWLWRKRNNFYASGNLSIYYSFRQHKTQPFPGPDFFVVLNTERKPRSSWVVWEEDGKYPNIIVEILSAKTADTDRHFKKQLYQDVFRTPEFFWFDPQIQEFKGFTLVSGEYQELQPNAEGWLWSQQLRLYLGVRESKLRLFTERWHLVPTPEEVARQAEHLIVGLEAQLARYREHFGELID